MFDSISVKESFKTKLRSFRNNIRAKTGTFLNYTQLLERLLEYEKLRKAYHGEIDILDVPMGVIKDEDTADE